MADQAHRSDYAMAHPMRLSTAGRLRELAAIGSVLVILGGCGIAGQSPTPGATSTPAAVGTGTPVASGTPGATGTPTATETAGPTATPEGPIPSPAGQLRWGNWIGYIDIDDETGDYPTIEKFEQESGIDVSYFEDINDNEEFFSVLQPDLAAGNPAGYDMVVMSDWMIERLIRLNYLEPLDYRLLPNVQANAQELYLNPWYDPGNVYSVPWQSGIVGIGYNPELTGRPITTFDDLFDPEFAGRVGLFSEMRDTMSLTLLSMGVVPTEATIEDVQAAQQKLLAAAARGQFRDFYGNDYYDALAREDLVATMAWSGDVTQMKLFDNADVEFIIPESGGMLFVDNMIVPKNAPGYADAVTMMNFWYDLDNATALTEYIGYFSPVRGVAERVLDDAQTARDEGDEEWATQLEVISETAFPTEEQLEDVYQYKVLDQAEERIWNDLFNEVVLD